MIRNRTNEAPKSQGTNFGTSFVGLLTLLFIGLKLGGIITWSWIWVLSPIWIVLLIVLTSVLLIGLGIWFVERR